MSNEPFSEQWHRAAIKWAEYEQAASLLEESKSAYLSQLMTACGDIPVSKAELRAKSTPEWKSYITRMVDARTKANLAKIEAEFLKMQYWDSQSAAATERVQARL